MQKVAVAGELTLNKRGYFATLRRDIWRDRYLYLLLSLGVIYIFIFRYIPMYGLQIAFQNYNMFNPAATYWVGFQHFETLFSTHAFPNVLWNTLNISLLKLLFGFPAPIILALLLNEFRHLAFKKVCQTLLYLPFFISWVIMTGIIQMLLHPTHGVITEFMTWITGNTVHVLTSTTHFVPMLIITELWKNMGWGTIIFFAAISNVDDQLYEAAVMDGAGKLKQAIHITLPSIRPVIIIVLILSLGNIMNAGFDQIFMLYNPMVFSVADIIDTYVFRRGIIQADYSFAAAAGFFRSFVALILIVLANYAVRLFGDDGIW